jgi:dipeptidyl-peptidase 4
MRNFFCLVLGLFLFSVPVSTAQKPITLDDIWVNGTYSPKGVEGFNFTKDGKHHLRQEGKNIVEYDLLTGKPSRTLFDGDKNTDLPAFDSYTFSPDGAHILFSTKTESIYRHSTRAHYFIVSSVGGAVTEILPKAVKTTKDTKIMYATFSPDGQKVAYMYQNNLFYYDIATTATKQITTDGAINQVINGGGDWVYEEELVLVRAFEWSDDSRSIGWVRLDESAVPEFRMETHDNKELYPGEVRFKYPKVGEANAKASVLIYDLPSANIRSVSTPGTEYIARIKWTPDHQLCITTLNRLQNKLQLLLANRETAATRTLLEENRATYIEIHDNLRWLEGGKSFLWTSEKDGFNQLYWYNIDGTLRQKITKEAADVTEFYGIDEANQVLYYQAAACSPLEREVYQYDIKRQKCHRLSPKKGTNSATFSPGFQYFSLKHSTINAAPQHAIYDKNGTLIRVLEENTALAARMQETARVDAEFFDFKIPSGERLNGFIMKPKNAETSGVKYPVLMFVYGGPGSQQVVNDWKGGNYWWFQYLVQQGYVVACVDNRGTGARGTKFREVTYGQLGKYETQDQIEAAKWLGGRKFVDKSRIGIFGWSYGGYMSSRSLFEGGKVFKAAIAVAPVTNWKWYDSVYTERYMGLYADNQAGYDDNAPIAFAEKLEGAFLLVHGLADDNVHFQHTAELANELIRNGKQYQTMIYPNKNHSIGGGKTRLHLYTLMTEFLAEKLKKQEGF